MIGVSLVGSGRMGQVYARNFHDSPSTRLARVVNSNLPSAGKLADDNGAAAVADIHPSLADSPVDAVIISPPTNTHLEMNGEVGEAGDLDTRMTVLKMTSVCLVHVNNNRKSVYGFDQRIEAFGSGGMVQARNRHEDNLLHSSRAQTMAQAPLNHFFLERFAASFQRMVQKFVDPIDGRTVASLTFGDGRVVPCNRITRHQF